MIKRVALACATTLILFGSLLFFGCRAGVNQVHSDYAGGDLPQERWDWVNEQWTGDNRPFQKIKQDITTALDSGQNAGDLAAKYRLKAIASPKDSQAVFGWAYAVRANIRTLPASMESRMMWFRVREALDQPPSPHAYDYDRLRFLLAYDKSHIRGLGERLLKQNPADNSVKLQLIYAYINSFGTSLLVSESAANQFKVRALQLTGELIQSDPKNPDYRAALGNLYAAYLSRHYQDKRYNRDDAVKALTAYQDYQRIAKPNDDFYRDSITMSNNMKRFLDTGELK